MKQTLYKFVFHNAMKSRQIIISIIVSFLLSIAIFFVAQLTIDFQFLFRIIFFYGLALLFVFLIQRQYNYYLPSFYLFFMFSIIPLFAIPGYVIFINIYHAYLGTHLDVKYALGIWVQGLFFVMLGIFLVYLIKRRVFVKLGKDRLGSETYSSWDWGTFNFILFLFVAISLFCTVISIIKLGSIPILKGDIERDRFFYIYQSGEWYYKLSRLWLVVYFLTFIKLLRNIKLERCFLLRKNFAILGLLISAVFFDAIYGDRFHLFIMFFYSIIMLNKVIGRVRMRLFLMVFFGGIVFSGMIFIIRGADPLVGKYNIFERLMLNTFTEWREFAYILKNFPSANFMHGRTFLSIIGPVFPKQIWEVFGINKFALLDATSAGVMKDFFGHYAGIRIGIIGEGFINFGYQGIIFVSFIAGLIIGILENIFIGLHNFDMKEVFFAFVLAMMVFLPIAQTDAISAPLFFYLYFFIICIVFLRRKVK